MKHPQHLDLHIVVKLVVGLFQVRKGHLMNTGHCSYDNLIAQLNQAKQVERLR